MFYLVMAMRLRSFLAARHHDADDDVGVDSQRATREAPACVKCKLAGILSSGVNSSSTVCEVCSVSAATKRTLIETSSRQNPRAVPFKTNCCGVRPTGTPFNTTIPPTGSESTRTANSPTADDGADFTGAGARNGASLRRAVEQAAVSSKTQSRESREQQRSMEVD